MIKRIYRVERNHEGFFCCDIIYVCTICVGQCWFVNKKRKKEEGRSERRVEGVVGGDEDVSFTFCLLKMQVRIELCSISCWGGRQRVVLSCCCCVSCVRTAMRTQRLACAGAQGPTRSYHVSRAYQQHLRGWCKGEVKLGPRQWRVGKSQQFPSGENRCSQLQNIEWEDQCASLVQVRLLFCSYHYIINLSPLFLKMFILYLTYTLKRDTEVEWCYRECSYKVSRTTMSFSFHCSSISYYLITQILREEETRFGIWAAKGCACTIS